MKDYTNYFAKAMLALIVGVLTFLVPMQGMMASVPTMEALFKNGSPAKTSGNVLSVKVKIIKKIQNVDQGSIYLKYFLNPNSSPQAFIQGVQAVYAEPSMEDRKIIGLKKIDNIKTILDKESPNLRSLYYYMLAYILCQDTYSMMGHLKKFDTGIIFATEQLNREKWQLMNRYKQYLARKKKGSAEASPLLPSNPTSLKRVKSILNEPMYVASDKMNLAKIDQHFFWKINLEHVDALFDYDTHKFHGLAIRPGRLEVKVDQYILMDGQYQVPRRFLLIQHSEDPALPAVTYEISLIEYKGLNDSRGLMQSYTALAPNLSAASLQKGLPEWTNLLL